MHIARIPQHSIVIIGGGFAGALTAVKLLDQTEVPLAITIIEKRDELGRGIAYSSKEAVHLVNGPAEMFSLYPEDPGHLAQWLSENGAANGWQPPQDVAASSPPRYLYGTYLRDELNRAIRQARAGSTFRHIRSTAARLVAAPHRIQVATTNGLEIEADEAILALGVFQADPSPQEASVAGHPRFAASPWDPVALDRLSGAEEILLIGSSLSKVAGVLRRRVIFWPIGRYL